MLHSCAGPKLRVIEFKLLFLLASLQGLSSALLGSRGNLVLSILLSAPQAELLAGWTLTFPSVASSHSHPCIGALYPSHTRTWGWMHPYLGAYKDQGSLPYFSRLTPDCKCFLSSSMMCFSSTGHTGALPGTGSGEEQRCHRTQPGTMAPGSASLLLSMCTGRASPMPGTSSCPKLPKVERNSLFCCAQWAGKPSFTKHQSRRPLIHI